MIPYLLYYPINNLVKSKPIPKLSYISLAGVTIYAEDGDMATNPVTIYPIFSNSKESNGVVFSLNTVNNLSFLDDINGIFLLY